MATKQDLLLLFQRPHEPVFGVKEDENGQKVRIDAPPEFYSDKYKDIASEVQNRFGEDGVNRTVPISSIALPDLSFTNPIPRKKPFSLFNPTHKRIAARLIQLFMEAPDARALMALGAYTRDRVNEMLFQYAMSVAMQHRPDTQDVALPSVAETFPEQFVDPQVFPQARESTSFVPATVRQAIEIPPNYTANEKEPEQRLAYFREDIGVNLHHWHWHLVYPGSASAEIVGKDRRGELFYYMHSQLIARYNIDRLANRLSRVRPLSNFREPIPEAYFPKLSRSTTNTSYPPRVANSLLRDIDRPEDSTTVEVADLERWRDRIFEAIDKGFVINTNGQQIPLDEVRGIDILGDMIESSDLTPNLQLYGSLHNMGHNVIAYSHDPDSRHLEQYGVMGDVTTAMRDPIFYRWHSFIDQVFRRHKNRLTPYVPAQHFAFNGVTVNSVRIQVNQRNAPANTLLTFWQRAELNLGTGLDFGREGNVFASFTHLQHAPFAYNIQVANAGAARRGTCRIFIAPRMDERGTTLNFRDQQPLLIEMDRFTVNLTPGVNNITRRGEESSVTIPYQRTFRNIGASPMEAAARSRFEFCGCGWPQHMLLPKGSPEGVIYDVFVMVSDYENDRVDDVYDANDVCSDSSSYCGIRNKRYPDRQAMGFPFDRRSDATSLQNFASRSPNMRLGEVTIRFSNRYVARTS